MLGKSLCIQLRLRNVKSRSSIGSRNAPTIKYNETNYAKKNVESP